jgi:CRP/FNR family cyclic AMP-dependent transcriptional regulator
MLQDATFGSLEARLARQLLHLAGRGSRQTPDGLRLAGRYRQADLADLMGATTRSIITILNQWRADDRIAFDADHGFITLRDVDGPRALTQPAE